MSDPALMVDEIFGPTIQGEGEVVGRYTVFVRLAGCDYKCNWCDSLHAVIKGHSRPWTRMSAQEVAARVEQLSPPCLVTISGGNPLLFDCELLISLLHDGGYSVAVETQGSVFKPWLREVDFLTLSPKPPSSGHETDWDVLFQCADAAFGQLTIKVVVFGDEDYAYAKEVYEQMRHQARFYDAGFYLSVGTPQVPDVVPDIMSDFRWLAEKVVSDRWPVAVLPQLHVLAWGAERGR